MWRGCRRPGGADVGSHGRKPMVGVSARYVAPEGPTRVLVCEVAPGAPARAVTFQSDRDRVTLPGNVGAFDGPSGADVRRGHTFHGLPPMANSDGPSGATDCWVLPVSDDDPVACPKDHSETRYVREACSALAQTSRAYRFMAFHGASNEKRRNGTYESCGRPSIFDRPCGLLSRYPQDAPREQNQGAGRKRQIR